MYDVIPFDLVALLRAMIVFFAAALLAAVFVVAGQRGRAGNDAMAEPFGDWPHDGRGAS